jgi:hypothetical protein
MADMLSPQWLFDPVREVLPVLESDADARLLLTHPRTQRVRMEGGGFHVLDPLSGRLRATQGLTKPLQQLYWPDYAPMSRTKSPVARALKRAAAGKRAPRLVGRVVKAARAATGASEATKAQEAASGPVRGSIVHRQLHDWLTLDAASFESRNPEGRHPWTTRVLQQCLARGWLPLLSEYRVYDEIMGVATAIDSVWVTHGGTLVFVELKTSKSRALFHLDDVQSAPMAGVAAEHGLPSSALARAKVQLGISVIMAAQGLGLRGHWESYVLLVTDELCEFHALSDGFLLGPCASIYRDMTTKVPALRRARRNAAAAASAGAAAAAAAAKRQ